MFLPVNYRVSFSFLLASSSNKVSQQSKVMAFIIFAISLISHTSPGKGTKRQRNISDEPEDLIRHRVPPSPCCRRGNAEEGTRTPTPEYQELAPQASVSTNSTTSAFKPGRLI